MMIYDVVRVKTYKYKLYIGCLSNVVELLGCPECLVKLKVGTAAVCDLNPCTI